MTASYTADPVLVIGASLAGATCAAALREAGFVGDITLLGAEAELPYERPALSKGYLTGGAVAADLLVYDEPFYGAHRIGLRLGEVATGLDVERRRVQLSSGPELSYGTLVIATGATNLRPPIPGIGLSGVHQLRTQADAADLRTAAGTARTAVIVGMGFIGCEVAASLHGLGLQVTAVDGLPGPLWGPLGPELSAVARRWHEQRGVTLLGTCSVTAFVPDAGGTRVAAVQLSSGDVLLADLVVVGVGVRPETRWLTGSPVQLVAGGAVGVDVDGRTNVDGVWAIGDVAATWNAGTSRHERHEHWASAIAGARRAAHRIAGPDSTPGEVAYFWSDQYDKTLQYSGSHDADCRLVVRGDLTDPDRPVVAFFLRGGVVTAVLAVGAGRDFRRGERLLGRTLDPEQLADPSVDLRSLAQPIAAP